MNSSAALAHLLDRGRLTRNDLRELTGLSKPTVSDALRRLTEAGLATVVGHVSAGPGPNAEVYTANPEAAFAVAVSVRDSGGSGTTALAAAVCDLTGEVRGRQESSVDIGRTTPVSGVAEAVTRLCADARVPANRVGHVQLGVAGSYDPRTQAIRHVSDPGWNAPGLVGEIRSRLATAVSVENDVNLAAIAERRRGVGAGADGFALLWLSGGLGLAIDLGGTLLRGARGGAGEIGYMPLVAPEGAAQGTVDFQDLVGGPAVLALAARYGIPGRTPAEALAAAIGAGSEAPFLTALADRIAVGLAAVVAVLDPPLVVLAGEVGQAGGAVLRDAVAAALTRATPLETVIAASSVSDDAVLLGALDAGLDAVRHTLISSVHTS